MASSALSANHFTKVCRSALPHKTDALEQTEQCGNPSDCDDGQSLSIDAIKNDTAMNVTQHYHAFQEYKVKEILCCFSLLTILCDNSVKTRGCHSAR